MECFGAGGGFSVGPATCFFAIKGNGADGRRRSQTAEPAKPAEPAEPARPATVASPWEPAKLASAGHGQSQMDNSAAVSDAKDLLCMLQSRVCFTYVLVRFCFWGVSSCWRFMVCVASDRG